MVLEMVWTLLDLMKYLNPMTWVMMGARKAIDIGIILMIIVGIMVIVGVVIVIALALFGPLQNMAPCRWFQEEKPEEGQGQRISVE
jgi:hypothetical protein